MNECREAKVEDKEARAKVRKRHGVNDIQYGGRVAGRSHESLQMTPERLFSGGRRAAAAAMAMAISQKPGTNYCTMFQQMLESPSQEQQDCVNSSAEEVSSYAWNLFVYCDDPFRQRLAPH